MRTIHLTVDGMRCRRCVRQATALLRDVPGVASVVADSTTSHITVTGDLVVHEVIEALAHSSFTVHVHDPAQQPPPAPTPADRRDTDHDRLDHP